MIEICANNNFPENCYQLVRSQPKLDKQVAQTTDAKLKAIEYAVFLGDDANSNVTSTSQKFAQ